MSQRMRLLLQGRVQGVGMRPFVCRLAQELGVKGWVSNTPQGVIIEAEGEAETLALFARRLPQELPPQARLNACSSSAIPVDGTEPGFQIQHSDTTGTPSLDVPPDLAACPACVRELFDPDDRRYRYPLLSCSHCGPRYSILRALPFDRERTSMAAFPLCALCLAEYQNPLDRRFHAQTVCCPLCGPQLTLWNADGLTLASGEAALAQAVALLRAGRILALKGVGGFQLLVDAADQTALLELRCRKHRPHKPFALLVDLPMARGLCCLEEDETALLTSPAAPIVLLRRLPQTGIADAVAPALPWLGLMLPASPLHHLLLHDFGAPLVATSGNLGGEPIAIDEQEALTRLRGIADGFLLHERAILRPLDDSLLRLAGGRPMLLRRARGYAPSPIALAEPLPPLLAVGGHMKNTVGLAYGHGAVLSQHLGDLDDALSLNQCRSTLLELPQFYGVQAQAVACDAHPDYAGNRLAHDSGLPIVPVPHHYAHALACVAEHHLTPPLLAVAWDGSGLGDNGALWGGEFLRLETDGYRRVASLWPLRLPGGEQAVKQPRRVALAALHAIYGAKLVEHLPETVRSAFSDAELTVLLNMLDRGLNAPLCSSVGRLFDAVSALLGLCRHNGFEGQAAMLLEAAALEAPAPAESLPAWPIQNENGLLRLDWRPWLQNLAVEHASGGVVAQSAYRFHRHLAAALTNLALQQGLSTVVLCGGCFQNRLLLELCAARLQAAGMQVFWPQRIPPNDGGLALGQLLACAGWGTKDWA